MKRLLHGLSGCVGALIATASLAQGAASAPGGAESVDRIVAASSLRLNDRTPGDLIAAGGRIEVNAPVDGDALLAGGELRLPSSVARSVHAAGGRVQIGGTIGRHLRVAGGQIELGSQAQVDGNATLFGGDVDVRGPVKGTLRVGAGRLLIDAAIGGDVHATAGRIELGPHARIGGALRWRSDNALQRDPAAQVLGTEERLEWPGSSGRERDRVEAARSVRHARGWLSSVWWTAGLMLLAAVLVAAFPAASARVARTLRERSGWSVLIGFVTLVCVPVAVLLLLITVIGAPLALLALLLYVVLLPLGYVACAVALGDAGLQRWRTADASRTGWRIGAVLLALLLLALLGRVPWLGGLVAFVAMLAGLGALALQAMPGRAAQTSTPAAAG